MNNSVILDHVNHHINNHIKDCKTETSLFKSLEVIKNHDSINNVYAVKNKIKYHDIVFYLGLEYKDKKMKILFDFNEPINSDDDFIEIAKFVANFKKINMITLTQKIEDYVKKN